MSELSRLPDASSGPSLAHLETVPLGRFEALLRHAERACFGSGAWRARKRAEARDLLALCALAPHRVVPAAPVAGLPDLADALLPPLLDLRGELVACVRLLDTPVACRRRGAGELSIEDSTTLVVRCPEEAQHRVIPGFHPVMILTPRDVWHPNVFSEPSRFEQPLCLGPGVLPGIRVKELVLLAYRALTMQQLVVDELDPAGVMNREAALWWQAPEHRARAPLTRAAFLAANGGKS